MTLQLKKTYQITLESYEKLFKQYYGELCLYAVSVVKNQEVAEEIVQDLFIKIWSKREELAIEKNVKSYLLRAVKNNCIMWHRKQSRHQHVELSEIDAAFLQPQQADTQVDANELNDLITRTFETLPPRCKEVFNLIRVEGLKYREVAEKLKISIKTVEKAMGKSLKVFRENLTEYVHG